MFKLRARNLLILNYSSSLGELKYSPILGKSSKEDMFVFSKNKLVVLYSIGLPGTSNCPSLSIKPLASSVLIEDSGVLKLHKENRHTIDMVEKNLVQLDIDHLQMGVGGEDSWGSQPMEEYQLKPKKYIYHFSMQLIEPSDEPRNIYKNSF